MSSSAPPRLALITGLYASVATGCFYGFSVYSKALKARFHLSQTQLSNINTVPYCVGIFSSLIGLASHRMGRRVTLLLGGLVSGGTQVLMYVLATSYYHSIMGSAQYVLPALAAGTFVGVALVTSVAMPTPVKLWPRNRALAVAGCKSFVGLGGAAVSQVYRVLYGVPTEDPGALRCLLLWAATTGLCVLIALLSVPSTEHETPPPEPRRALILVLAEIALLGVIATATPLASDGAVHTVMVGVTLVLAILPIPIVLWAHPHKSGGGTDASIVPTSHRHQPLLADTVSDPVSASTTASAARFRQGTPAPLPSTAVASGGDGPKLGCLNSSAGHACTALVPTAAACANEVALGVEVVGGSVALLTETSEQHTLLQMLRAPNAWLLFAVASTAHGGGCLVVTQLAFILQAAGASDRLLTTAVTTLNTGNLFGRLVAPSLSNVLVRRALPRPSFLVAIMALMGVAQSGLLWGASGALLPGSTTQATLLTLSATLGGLAFGAVWPMVLILASELFGSRHLEANYMFYDGGAGFLGAFVLAGLLPSYVYDRAESHQKHGNASSSPPGATPGAPPGAPPPPLHPVCHGPECFGPAHEVLIALCALGAIAAVALSVRTAPLYRLMRTAAGRGGP